MGARKKGVAGMARPWIEVAEWMTHARPGGSLALRGTGGALGRLDAIRDTLFSVVRSARAEIAHAGYEMAECPLESPDKIDANVVSNRLIKPSHEIYETMT